MKEKLFLLPLNLKIMECIFIFFIVYVIVVLRVLFIMCVHFNNLMLIFILQGIRKYGFGDFLDMNYILIENIRN